MPKAIKKKVVKTSKTEEGVKEVLYGTKDYIKERQKALLPVIIGAVVIAIAVAGFLIYRSQSGSKARAMEYEGYKIYYGLYQRQPMQKDEQYQKALEKFKEAYSSRKSAYSLYYMANCLYELGRFDEAQKDLKELTDRFSDDEGLVPLSLYKMALINLKKGDKEAALKSLDTLYNYKTGTLKDLALVESARILESMGKTDEARKKYEEITKNFPSSTFTIEALAKVGGVKQEAPKEAPKETAKETPKAATPAKPK